MSSEGQGAVSPLVGYCDRLAYRQGERVQVMASGAGPATVDLVQLHHPPDDPDWPVPLSTPVATIPEQRVELAEQRVHRGSYVSISGVGSTGLVPRTAALRARATHLAAEHPQALLSTLDPASGRGFAVVLHDGLLRLLWGRGDGAPGRLDSGTPLLQGLWYNVAVSLDEAAGWIRLAHWPLRDVPGDAASWAGNATDPDLDPGVAGGVLLGAARLPGVEVAVPLPGSPSVGTTFNGKLESPVLSTEPIGDRSLADVTPEALANGAGVLAAWDFSLRQDGSVIVDVGPHSLHGRAVNRPARAVTGSRWRGRELSWVQVPEEYGAIHLHDDDLEDCGWPVTTTLTLPEDLRSAVYGVRVREAGGREDVIPLVVAPGASGATAKDALVVLPSYTYLAYANLLGTGGRSSDVAAGLAAEERKHYPEYERLEHFPELQGSLYDVHSDGSGRIYSSARRPILSMRPDWMMNGRDAYRHLGADLYIVAWLEQLGVTFDVISDHLLHAGGPEALAGYSVVLTGSHPEYVSERMLDSYREYLDGGGSLFYLGGNGFYWVTAESSEAPEMIEVRRGHAGTRPWTSDAGEAVHSFTGEPGGLWRHRGRPPNELVGIGFAAQGVYGTASPYRRTPESYRDEYRFVFAGIDGPVFGEAGFDMGGAAGDEVDRFDVRLGSPPWGTVLASSQDLGQYYKLVIEELQVARENVGADCLSDARADLVLTEHPAGGLVFAVGSISWVQAMAVGFFDNATSRITQNVLFEAMRRRAAATDGREMRAP